MAYIKIEPQCYCCLFFPLTKETTGVTTKSMKQRTKQMYSYHPVSDHLVPPYGNQFYFNWAKYRRKPITKISLNTHLSSQPYCYKNTSPTPRRTFYSFQGLRLRKLLLELIFIKTCFSDCDEGQIQEMESTAAYLAKIILTTKAIWNLPS